MLKELQAARPDLQVVGIAIDKRDPVVEFAGNIEFNYPILIGQNEAWAAAGALGVNIYALPFTIFTAGDGSILGVHTGELHAEHLERFRSVTDDLGAGASTSNKRVTAYLSRSRPVLAGLWRQLRRKPGKLAPSAVTGFLAHGAFSAAQRPEPGRARPP